MEGTDLSGIPVELDGAVRFKVGFQQSPVRFQDGDGSTAIIVGTWGTEVSDLKTNPAWGNPYQGRGGTATYWCLSVA